MFSGPAKDPEFRRMMDKVKRLYEWCEWERPEFDQCGCRIRLKPFWLKGNTVQNVRVLVGRNLRVSLVTVAGVTSCVFGLGCREQPESLRLFVFLSQTKLPWTLHLMLCQRMMLCLRQLS